MILSEVSWRLRYPRSPGKRIMHAVSDFLLAVYGQSSMPFNRLQTENAQVGQREVNRAQVLWFLNEVVIIVETCSLVNFKDVFPGLVMPRLIILHCSMQKRYDQPLGLSGLLIFPGSVHSLTESRRAWDEPNFNAVFICDALGIARIVLKGG